MNDGKAEWYASLNQNERRIVDIFIETKCRFLIPRPELERRLCKTRLMNQRTLTDRLDYLIERGCIGKLIGEKGAVFYAPRPAIDMALRDPPSKRVVETAVNNASPKNPIIYSIPVKPEFQIVSEAEMGGLYVRSAMDWEKFGVGSKREKEKVYRGLRQLWKRKRGAIGMKETTTERMLRKMRDRDDAQADRI